MRSTAVAIADTQPKANLVDGIAWTACCQAELLATPALGDRKLYQRRLDVSRSTHRYGAWLNSEGMVAYSETVHLVF
jgi:hypothetical protein